ncbi:MAG: epoxyqueuosine reductase QueH [bacterium]|nr:epoxyqueuosine reductase QueH [bacterium]
MNYQKELEKIIEKVKLLDYVPTLLLHSCCAPCSSYVLEYLSNYFKITIFYYNPNIYPQEEFNKRVEEQIRLINELPVKNKVSFIKGKYDNGKYEQMIKGLEQEKEGSSRCFICYRLRLEETAKIAKKNNFDFFTTTLSISPYKNSSKLNEIGYELQKIYNVNYLFADFKKNNGYKRSIELSKIYNLYRQDYCGCIYSKKK